MPVSNRIAWPFTLTWQVSLSTEMTSSILSGVRESETSVAMRSPTLRSRSASLGPISLMVPSNMPPEPVSGLWCLPRFAMIPRLCLAIFWTSPPSASSIWVKLAASMLSVSTSMRISLS